MINIGDIRNIPFFHSFDDFQLKEIVPYFIEVKLKAGETLIQKGKVNYSIHFIIQGTASVSLDGKHIVDLDKLGEVIGEVSMAINSPSTANVTAKTDMTLYKFAFEEMRKKLPEKARDGILKNFYKGGMEILAHKLKSTNARNLIV
jgi:CRP-like cAMP-binding protein